MLPALLLRAATGRPLPDGDVTVPDLVLDMLATYRLTTLVKDDKIAEDFRRVVFRRFGTPEGEHSHKLSYLVTCPWCLSIYFGALAVGARAANRRVWNPVATSLAMSTLVGLLAEARSYLQSASANQEPDAA